MPPPAASLKKPPSPVSPFLALISPFAKVAAVTAGLAEVVPTEVVN